MSTSAASALSPIRHDNHEAVLRCSAKEGLRLVFLGFFNPYYFPPRLKEEFFTIDIHPSAHPRQTASRKPSRKQRESLGKGFVSGNICRSDDSCTRKCSPQRMQRDGSRSRLGIQRDSCFSHWQRRNLLTRLLGGPSLNSDPLLAVGADLAGRPDGPV